MRKRGGRREVREGVGDIGGSRFEERVLEAMENEMNER